MMERLVNRRTYAAIAVKASPPAVVKQHQRIGGVAENITRREGKCNGKTKYKSYAATAEAPL